MKPFPQKINIRNEALVSYTRISSLFQCLLFLSDYHICFVAHVGCSSCFVEILVFTLFQTMLHQSNLLGLKNV